MLFTDNSLESRLSTSALGSDKVSMQKIGNSKILVVKKKGGSSAVRDGHSKVNSPPPMMGGG